MAKCGQCDWLCSSHEVLLQPDGRGLCESCRIGQTDPHEVIRMFIENKDLLFGDGSNEVRQNNLHRLQKQTGLTLKEISDFVAIYDEEDQKNTNDNDLVDSDGIPEFDETEPNSSNEVWY